VDRESMLRIEEFRRKEAGPLEGTLIDEFVDGGMDRSTFIRRASVLGLSMTTIGAALKAFGHAPLAQAATGAVLAGGRLRIGVVPPPVTGLDPHTYKDTGGLVTGGIAGEFLTRATSSPVSLYTSDAADE
jgi:peptide/nickel transport system substrate-binding protein